MRDPEVWAHEINVRDEYRDDITLTRLIERVQRDAIEAAAKVCEERGRKNREVAADCTNRYDRVSLKYRAAAYETAAQKIRALLPPQQQQERGETP